MKNQRFFRVFLTIFALALPFVLPPPPVQAACFCEEILEWYPYTAIAYGCSTAAYNAAQIALQDAQSLDICAGGVECLVSYFQVSCDPLGGSNWQSEVSVKIGCRTCN